MARMSSDQRYIDFLADLAVIYPEIQSDLPSFTFLVDPLANYRVHDAKVAADEIRAATQRKKAEALIKEFRSK